MWRWFHGVVILRRDDHVMGDHHIHQSGFRIPFNVLRLPDVLEGDVPRLCHSTEPVEAVEWLGRVAQLFRAPREVIVVVRRARWM